MEPKYKAESALYRRATAPDPSPWEPGQLCILPSEVMADIEDRHYHDFGACWVMIRRIENQVFDMMGGIQY